jgi:hypothetical protein
MLDRRDFLAALGSGIIVGTVEPEVIVQASLRGKGRLVYGGWIPPSRTMKNRHLVGQFQQAGAHLKNTGRGKRVLLWKFFERLIGSPLVPHDQGGPDCVGQGYALGTDVLSAVQIAVTRKRDRWVAKAAVEPIYAGSRVETSDKVLRGEGSNGIWAAKWCNQYGILHRKPYLNGKYDFTEYSFEKARKWGHICTKCTPWGGGVPEDLEQIAKRHPIKTYTLVKSWPEARDAIANGYPVIICSNVGFVDTRDKDGFARAKGKWLHCLLLAGIDDISSRSGGLLINSWGPNWITGPTRFGQPAGSFWVDAETLNRMLKQGDSFAISNYVDLPRRDLDYRLY